jgi:hypothetical protein
VGKIEVEHLLSEHKAMSSIPSTEGKKKERERTWNMFLVAMF